MYPKVQERAKKAKFCNDLVKTCNVNKDSLERPDYKKILAICLDKIVMTCLFQIVP